MYIFKDKTIPIKKSEASKIIGITRQYLTDVINGKKQCSKLVAYCITKYLDPEAEILDYFIREEN